MLALIGAMDREIRDLRNSMSMSGIDERDGFPVYRGTYRGRRLLLARSGVGRQRAERACRSLLDRFPVTAIISFGFAGALKDSLKVGDVVACSSIVCSEASRAPSCVCDDSLLLAAQSCKLTCLSRGVGITATGLAGSRTRKRQLYESSGADVVDMESYWVGSVAADSRVPFIAVRSVSDSARESLPDVPAWRLRHLAPHFVLHPALAFSLYRGAGLASRSMTDFMGRMIEATA